MIRKKDKPRNLIITIIAIILAIIGTGCILTAIIMQAILFYEMFGVFVIRLYFIPHWSAWFYLGAIPDMLAAILFEF